MKKITLLLLTMYIISILQGCCSIWHSPPGCRTFWYKSDKTYDQCQRDYYTCVICTMDKSATAQLPWWVIDNCMAQKGYSRVMKWQLPFNVKREVGEVYWDKGVGFAGCK